MNDIVNGVGNYLVAGAAILACAGTVAFWNPASTSKTDVPEFNNRAPAMLLPPGMANQPNPPPSAALVPGDEMPVPLPLHGSPVPSVEGNMPSRAPGEHPGLNTPPRSEAPVPTAPRPTLPVEPSPVNQPPSGGQCPIGLRVDPLLGICVSI